MLTYQDNMIYPVPAAESIEVFGFCGNRQSRRAERRTCLAERGHSCPQQLANWKTASIRRPVGIYHVAADKNVRAPLNRYGSWSRVTFSRRVFKNTGRMFSS